MLLPSRHTRRHSRTARHRHRRGAVAILMAVMLPVLLGVSGLAIDLGLWFRESARLQMAADAAAMGAARLLSSSTATQADYGAAANLELQAVSGGLWLGKVATPVVIVALDKSQVTVKLTGTADQYLTAVLSITPPALSATAVAGVQAAGACILALSPTAAPGIQVDNMGSIVANGCGIFADSVAPNAIYLNSGTIKGSSIGAVGAVTTSNSGSNTLSPSPGTSFAAPQTDPFAQRTAPNPGACTASQNDFTANQPNPYQFGTHTGYVFCGNVTIGGNGTTDKFDPGVYYVVNGNLTFNNAAITQAAGVTFVLTGSNPGAFSWTNYSNTTTPMSAPTSGATANILVWQTCPASGKAPANTLAGGSTLQIAGEIYTPCGQLNLSNNARITPQSGGGVGITAAQVIATGSASVTASPLSGSGGVAQVMLIQ